MRLVDALMLTGCASGFYATRDDGDPEVFEVFVTPMGAPMGPLYHVWVVDALQGMVAEGTAVSVADIERDWCGVNWGPAQRDELPDEIAKEMK
jgi:hypothetical protein